MPHLSVTSRPLYREGRVNDPWEVVPLGGCGILTILVAFLQCLGEQFPTLVSRGVTTGGHPGLPLDAGRELRDLRVIARCGHGAL